MTARWAVRAKPDRARRRERIPSSPFFFALVELLLIVVLALLNAMFFVNDLHGQRIDFSFERFQHFIDTFFLLLEIRVNVKVQRRADI